MNASELWATGAAPIDLTSARLLWKSPWWAKVLDSIEDVSVSERDFIIILGRLYRDCTQLNKSKITMPEFADLASMARKVRWRNIGPGFGHKHSGLIRKKLSFLQWNPEKARFEFNPNLCPPKPAGTLGLGWKMLSAKAKRRRGAKIRKWKKEHKEERIIERLESEIRVSKMVAHALTNESTSAL